MGSRCARRGSPRVFTVSSGEGNLDERYVDYIRSLHKSIAYAEIQILVAATFDKCEDIDRFIDIQQHPYNSMLISTNNPHSIMWGSK